MRRIRKIHQIRITNKRPRCRPRKLTLRDQRILALSEYSDEDEVKEAFLHTAEEEMVNLHCTLLIRIKFTGKTVA